MEDERLVRPETPEYVHDTRRIDRYYLVGDRLLTREQYDAYMLNLREQQLEWQQEEMQQEIEEEEEDERFLDMALEEELEAIRIANQLAREQRMRPRTP